MRLLASVLLVAAILLGISGCSKSRDLPAAEAQAIGSRGTAPVRNAGTPSDPRAKLVSAGESSYWAGNYDSARAAWLEALRQAQAAGDDTAQARILTWLGLTSWRKGDYRGARQIGEAALSLKLLHHLDADLFKSYNALGLLAWNEGRLGDATELFEKAMVAARARRDREGVGKASGNLGLVYGEEGEFAKAKEGFATMRRVGSELKDARIEGNALDNQAMLQIKLGEPSSAIPTLLEARRLYHSIDYGNGEQNALGQLGTAYEALGDQKAAFAALDSALALSRTQGLRQEEASNLELIAELYGEAGDIPRALRFYGDAQAIEKELGLSIQGAANLRNIAEIDASLGKLEAANSLATNALRMHRTAKARTEEVHDLLFLAELSQMANHPRSVAANLDAAERLIGQLGWRRARVELALTRARIADRAHQPRATIRALGSSDKELLTSGLGLEWEAYALRARAHARLGALDSAIIIGRQAVAAVERVRSTIGSGTLRNSYLSDRESAYLDLVDVLLRSNRTEEALEVSDKMRGRALREHLAALNNDAGETAPSSVTALAARETILRRIDALVTRLDELDAASAADRDSMATITAKGVSEKLTEARGQYETLVIRAEQLESGQLSLLGGAKVVIADVRYGLSRDEALLEYLVTPARLLVFVVTRQGVRVVKAPITAEELSARVRVALGLLGTPGQSPSITDGVMRELGDALMSPEIRSALPQDTRRLIIVPHSILTYLPFAALQDRKGRYLVEDFDIVGLPSASALPTLRKRRRDLGANGVAFRSADLLAPFPTQLPGTLREAQAGARAIGGSTMYVGERANEPRLRSALRTDAVVHVATHAVMNARNPMFSRIELSRGKTGGSGDDGRLEVHEVLQLRVRSPLVFLSGCETAAGVAGSTHWSRGEDYATLAQAFLYAGTRNVIATLWKIEDQTSANFAGRFYGHLRASSAADAIALTQREMIHDSRFNAPYYWAPYVIDGEGFSTAEMQNRRVSSVQWK
jgi:CHAT domain-containing protein/tetratricopeptide (TPR) repeat protein